MFSIVSLYIYINTVVQPLTSSGSTIVTNKNIEFLTLLLMKLVKYISGQLNDSVSEASSKSSDAEVITRCRSVCAGKITDAYYVQGNIRPF